MKNIYKFDYESDFGVISGVFYATKDELDKLIGIELDCSKTTDFEVTIKNPQRYVTLLSENPYLLKYLFDNKVDLSSGFNPLSCL